MQALGNWEQYDTRQDAERILNRPIDGEGTIVVFPHEVMLNKLCSWAGLHLVFLYYLRVRRDIWLGNRTFLRLPAGCQHILDAWAWILKDFVVHNEEYLVLSDMSVGHDMKPRWARGSLNWASESWSTLPICLWAFWQCWKRRNILRRIAFKQMFLSY